MGPEPILSSKTAPCPSCGGAVRGDAHWCTLCYADLRPAPPVAVPASAPVTVPAQAPWGAAAADPLTDPLTDPLLALFPTSPYVAAHAPYDPLVRTAGSGDLLAPAAPVGAGHAEAAWPCSRCGATNPMTAAACAGCGGEFLSAVRSTAPLLPVPGLGDLATMSRTRRALVALGAVAVIVVPVLLLTAVTGHGGAAPAPASSTVPSTGPSLPPGLTVPASGTVPGTAQ